MEMQLEQCLVVPLLKRLGVTIKVQVQESAKKSGNGLSTDVIL